MIPNWIRKTIGRINNTIFTQWWNFYYKYGSRCPPKKFYHKKWIEDPECWEWDYLHYGEFYDPTCFPLPFKINCIGCHGCANNHDPLLSPDKHKGPWKIATAETFNQNYEELFGKEALVELLYNLEKHNEFVDQENAVNRH